MRFKRVLLGACFLHSILVFSLSPSLSLFFIISFFLKLWLSIWDDVLWTTCDLMWLQCIRFIARHSAYAHLVMLDSYFFSSPCLAYSDYNGIECWFHGKWWWFLRSFIFCLYLSYDSEFKRCWRTNININPEYFHLNLETVEVVSYMQYFLLLLSVQFEYTSPLCSSSHGSISLPPLIHYLSRQIHAKKT